MWWVKKEEKSQPSKSHPSPRMTGISGETFEDAERQFTENPRQEESSGAVAEKQEEKLVIKLEWAQVALEGCFYPFARLDHPAWALSEEESLKGAPKMQTFLQMLADKIAPAMLARVVNKYPDFAALVPILLVLYFQNNRLAKTLNIPATA